ncbi:MAG: S9 family peptidase, partial [Chloroflexota bacterium]
MTDEKRLITVEDVTRIRYVEDPQLSPDGAWVAYVVKRANMMKKGYDRDIYLAKTDGSQTTRLTRAGNNSSPRWSPDGTELAFVSSRADRPQIYVLPIGTPGEARALTSHENGATSPAWSPDGTQIAYLSRSNEAERVKEDSADKPDAPRDELDGKHRKERQQHEEKERFDPRPMERIPYRQGTAFMDDRHGQIYVIDAHEPAEDSDEKITPQRLTNLPADYSPPVWSKSGRTIVTTRTSEPERDEPWTKSNIYLIDMDSGIERRLADDEFAYFGAIPSYDGNWLICSRRLSESTDDQVRLTLLSLDGSAEQKELNTEIDRAIIGYDWLADGTLLCLIATEGRVELHKLDPQTATFTELVSEKNQLIMGFNTTKDGQFALVTRTPNQLHELFVANTDEPTLSQLTSVNQAFLDEVQVQESHTIWYENPNSDKVQGWYILPPDFDESKQYPLALNIHGGPHVMWSPSTPAMWHEWQTHAAAGYVVFFCNPRGSNGYGQQHLSAIRSNWGEVTMTDVMAGVDSMLEKGFIDENRMAITGGSFGGFMTAWIIGHTDRFVSAVPQRGVYNISSFYGTSDVPRLMSAEFEAEPWEDRDKYWEHSPLAYAHKVTTPTLIIHAENDFRVPIEQAEQYFAFIHRATDTPVKMLRYPREGHELSRSGEPAHRISRLNAMINWFDTYCQPEKLAQAEEKS